MRSQSALSVSERHLLVGRWIAAQLLGTNEENFARASAASGEGNGTPLQRSCLENPRDGGARWAAVCGVAQGRIRLQWRSSSKHGASQMALVVKNPPASAGDIRDAGLIPALGSSPGGGHGSPVQCSCLETLTDRGAWRAAVPRSQRVGRARSDLARTQACSSKRMCGFLLLNTFYFTAVPLGVAVSSLTRGGTSAPAVEGWRLNHWTTRQVRPPPPPTFCLCILVQIFCLPVAYQDTECLNNNKSNFLFSWQPFLTSSKYLKPGKL